MTDQNFILFDKYLHEELSDVEKQTFQTKLKRDCTMATAFDGYKDADFQLQLKYGVEKDKHNFRQKLSKIVNECREDKDTTVRLLKPWHYSVAASIVVLLGVYFLMQSTNPVFEDFNAHKKVSFLSNDKTNINLKLAQDYFNSKNYGETITQFEIVLKQNPTSEITLYYAIALTEMNRLTEAQPIFENIISKDITNRDRASWNLALLQLKQKDYQKCQATLKTISGDYEDHVAVQALLKKLEYSWIR
ncbi:tetratricopeptide repeat protein [Flavobacterium algicola]|uniref:tetratricopeptide repeat protein n=1 Tax=Flavobacterium algicola TaxID=556529 RepID=UPI001EFC943E|nr:tetratricopeptide repeat protein [Flavobacterium algicola]MCG9791651.1 tetratricopeptide repeat protein [Flavobacterium algicola]